MHQMSTSGPCESESKRWGRQLGLRARYGRVRERTHPIPHTPTLLPQTPPQLGGMVRWTTAARRQLWLRRREVRGEAKVEQFE